MENSMEVPYDTAISLLGETLTQKDPHSPVFTVVLLVVAKTRKQPKGPASDKWVKMRDVYTCTRHTHSHNDILLSLRRGWNNAICDLMDGPRDYDTKRSKPNREGQVSCDIISRWNLKYDTSDHTYKTETDSQIQKTNLQLPKERRGAEIS